MSRSTPRRPAQADIQELYALIVATDKAHPEAWRGLGRGSPVTYLGYVAATGTGTVVWREPGDPDTGTGGSVEVARHGPEPDTDVELIGADVITFSGSYGRSAPSNYPGTLVLRAIEILLAERDK